MPCIPPRHSCPCSRDRRHSATSPPRTASCPCISTFPGCKSALDSPALRRCRQCSQRRRHTTKPSRDSRHWRTYVGFPHRSLGWILPCSLLHPIHCDSRLLRRKPSSEGHTGHLHRGTDPPCGKRSGLSCRNHPPRLGHCWDMRMRSHCWARPWGCRSVCRWP